MKKSSCKSFLIGVALCGASSAFAATPVDLSQQPASYLNTFVRTMAATPSALKQTSIEADFNRTQHIRVQQTYAGYPVWGGDAVVHIPNGANASLKSALNNVSAATTMNGIVYDGLNKDLGNVPALLLTAEQASKAVQTARQIYQKKSVSTPVISAEQSKLSVYIDKNNQAHWVYAVSFVVKSKHAMPAKPTYIMDAMDFSVYKTWDDVKTLEPALGGGFGGNENERLGRLVYDGLKGNFSALDIQRDASSNTCYLQNAEVTVQDRRHDDAVFQYSCETPDAEHNNVYWNGEQDAVNGGYSPSNDALFVGKVVKEMYQKWYGIPVLTKNDKPMMLNMRVHEDMDNAYWDGESMTFGDGISEFYPLVSLGVGAHEVSHGFTEQHSGLIYDGQSGGLNESFSDMAAQAAEYYATKNNSWQIGPEIFKTPNEALRYMDEPTKDCNGGTPGSGCSIDHMSDYHDYLNVHYTSGIFNKVFYLIGSGTSGHGWTTKKAFNIMVHANRYYWTADTSFADAACGVIKATKDYGYSTQAVVKAFKEVGIKTKKC